MGETGRDSFNWIFKDLLLGRYDEVHNKDIYVKVVVLLGLFFLIIPYLYIIFSTMTRKPYSVGTFSHEL